MIGIWTQRFGFHHLWEIYLYQAVYGLFVCPVGYHTSLSVYICYVGAADSHYLLVV